MVSSCENTLVKPSELWIRWKSNPIALPAFDVWYDRLTTDSEFDTRYRNYGFIELGQISYMDNSCNDKFSIVIREWKSRYFDLAKDNRLPVFFDMEQSADVLAMASWNME